MKKFVAVLVFTLVAASSSLALAGKCGSNAGRNSNTTPTSAKPSGTSTDGAGVKH